MFLPFLSLFLIAAEPAKAPFHYVWATAYHVLPGTHTDESGYFSLCEGHNGKIYVGTAAYGFNAYLVEFDPKTGKQRIVVDVNKVCGLTPEEPTYAAQAKIHTRNFVAPSGKIYVGSKQGYRRGKDRDTADYPGGYVMVYDPATDKAENLGMPFKGEGVIDVTADEKSGLVYVVTCEDHHWMILDLKTKKYREPDPKLRLTPYAQTLLDYQGPRGRRHAGLQARPLRPGHRQAGSTSNSPPTASRSARPTTNLARPAGPSPPTPRPRTSSACPTRGSSASTSRPKARSCRSPTSAG